MKKLILSLVLLAALAIPGLSQSNNNAPVPDCTVQKILIRVSIAPGIFFFIYALIPHCKPHNP